MTASQFLSQPIFEKFQASYEHLPKQPGSSETITASSLEKFIETYGQEEELVPGEILFIQGDAADKVCWIEAGVLAILQGSLDDPKLLTFRYPGQVVGEIALLEDIQRTASVAAISKTRVRSLSKDKFQRLLDAIPDVGVDLMRLLSARLREVQPAEYSSGMYDHLTGAFSRRALDLRLNEELKRAQIYEYSFALVFIDLDHFKEINDTCGHARGDDVLVTFVKRIKADLRTIDLLFRYGGDEFVLILQGVDPERGGVLVQGLLDEAKATPIPGDPPIVLSFSAGIAYYPENGETTEALMKAADECVYRSKQRGRGMVVSAVMPEAPPDT
ncbi:MAG: GGDEF domain-containing protein [Anaerolineales bacterium]|nr:GGDEF domain-containing protein [Anaerolineales bacterium]